MRILIVGLAACLSLTACGSDEAAESTETPTVELPVVAGDVNRDDFCGLYAQIQCAASDGCCGVEARRAESIEACVAATRCPIDDPELSYDGKAAGDFLRAQVEAAQYCRSADTEITFLNGKGTAGAACVLGAGRPQCGAGLECLAAEGVDPAASTEGVCAARAASSADPCDEGSCARCEGDACEARDEAYCEAAAEPPPENTDWSDPDSLCLTAKDASDAGTTANVTLAFLYDGTWYPCTIVGGFDQGEERCCFAQHGSGTNRNSESSKGDLFIQMDDSDGLRFTSVKVKKGSSTQTRGTYRDSSTVTCKGCFLGYDCEDCWVDADGHDDCAVVQVPMSGSGVNYCANDLRHTDFF